MACWFLRPPHAIAATVLLVLVGVLRRTPHATARTAATKRSYSFLIWEHPSACRRKTLAWTRYVRLHRPHTPRREAALAPPALLPDPPAAQPQWWQLAAREYSVLDSARSGQEGGRRLELGHQAFAVRGVAGRQEMKKKEAPKKLEV